MIQEGEVMKVISKREQEKIRLEEIKKHEEYMSLLDRQEADRVRLEKEKELRLKKFINRLNVNAKHGVKEI
jgi:hypothetical protein